MNLSRWNIFTNPKCGLCQTPQPTMNHILTGCSIALVQGRYTWRHDSVLQILSQVHSGTQHHCCSGMHDLIILCMVNKIKS